MVRYSLAGDAMSISQLRQLVRQYSARQLNYAQFRAEFVSRFLSIAHADSLLNKVVALVEGVCADFSEEICDEAELMSRISSIIPEPIPVATTEG